MKRILFALLALAVPVLGQTPNVTLTVGTTPYLTINSAVSVACQPGASGLWQILIPKSAAPTDTIAGQNGCVRAYITDQRPAQTATCQWIAPNYVCATNTNPNNLSSYVQKAGDTMSGALGLPGDPVGDNDAANKHYVDIHGGGGGSYSFGNGLTSTGSNPTAVSANIGTGSTQVASGADSRIVNALQPGAIGISVASQTDMRFAAAISAVQPPSSNLTGLLPNSDFLTNAKPAYASILRALSAANNGGVARILLVGDSRFVNDTTIISGAIGLSVTFGHRWSDLLRTQLQAIYGSHGTGMVPVFGLVGQMAPNADWWGTPTTTLANECSIGPHGTSSDLCGVAALAAGASMSFKSNGIAYDTLRAYCEKSSTSGTLNVSIDGAGYVSICSGTAGSPTAYVGSVSAGSLGTHAVGFSCAAGGNHCLLYAAEGVAGTSGVSIDNVSVGGAWLGQYASDASTQFAFSDAIPEGENMVIEGHLTNEPANETTGQFQADLNTLITHERALGSKPSIELLSLAQDQPGNQALQPPYYAIIASTAAASSTGYVDVRNRTGAAFDPAIFGPDSVHENNQGNAINYKMIFAPWNDMPTPAGTVSGSVSTPGTPTVVGVGPTAGGVVFADASVPPFWPINDRSFALVITASSAVSPGTPIATVTFGKQGYKTDGTSPENWVCVSQQIGSGTAFNPLTVSAVSPTSVTFNAASTMSSGSTTPYTIQCAVDLEK